MQILLLSILFTTLLISLCLFVAFIHLEGQNGKGSELLHLVFFPYTGWGSWVYERCRKSGLKDLFPKDYYVYKHMGLLNIALSLGGLVAVFLMWSESFKYVGEGTEWANGTDHASMIGVGLLGDMLIGVGSLIYGGILLVLWFIASLVIIVFPFFLARSSKRAHLFHQLKKENEQLKSGT